MSEISSAPLRPSWQLLLCLLGWGCARTCGDAVYDDYDDGNNNHDDYDRGNNDYEDGNNDYDDYDRGNNDYDDGNNNHDVYISAHRPFGPTHFARGLDNNAVFVCNEKSSLPPGSLL